MASIRTKSPGKKREPNLNWVGPALQFLFGAILGALIGIGYWSESLESDHTWLAIPMGAVVLGTLAAIFGDRIWLGDSRRPIALAPAWERGSYKVMLTTGSRREETPRFCEGARFVRGEKTRFVARRGMMF